MRKQDRQPVRNVTGLEIKYDIEKNFAELRGLTRATQIKVQEQAKITEAELSLRIKYDETGKIVSMLNASADVISLKSNRLEIESDHFTLTKDGTVKATAGILGGCEIVNGALKIPVANILGTLTAANINADDLKVKAANITGTLTASQINADDLKIKAANVTGTITASQIDATNLKVSAANVTGTLLIGQLPSTVAETSDIPTKVSQLTNDSGYKNESGVVSIVKGTVTADYVNALAIKVKNANIAEKLTASNIDVSGIITAGGLVVGSQLPTKVSQLTNDSGYKNESGVVSIVKGTVNADYVNALGIKVNSANITGTLTIGQLPSTVAETSDIPTKVSQLTNDSGYKNESGVVSIINGRITADYINSLGISVNAANITGTLTASQINSDGIVVNDGIIGGFVIEYDDNFNGTPVMRSKNGISGTLSYGDGTWNTVDGYIFTVFTIRGVYYVVKPNGYYTGNTLAKVSAYQSPTFSNMSDPFGGSGEIEI